MLCLTELVGESRILKYRIGLVGAGKEQVMFGIKMGKIWTVRVSGKRHIVEVKRMPWLAIGVVNCDGERVGMFPAKALSLGLFFPKPEINFEISGVPCMVRVSPGLMGYNYDLYINEKLIEADVV